MGRDGSLPGRDQLSVYQLSVEAAEGKKRNESLERRLFEYPARDQVAVSQTASFDRINPMIASS